MTRTLLGAMAVAGVLCMTAPVFAHHSAAPKYDSNKPITIKGQITKVEWMNPHIFFYVDVKDDKGTVTNWAIEGSTPNQLYRRGWRKDSLKIGDVVTVDGYQARQEGLHHLNSRNVVLPDGRKIFSGSSEDGLPSEVK
jgi:DNA/RNA endonuclease YhcR with UshA esterase domain